MKDTQFLITHMPGVPRGVAYSLILILNFVLNSVLLSPEGEFVYDDREAILNNHDLLNSYNWISWKNIWIHDFWGTSMHSIYSHKSYRPIAVLSYKLQLFFGFPSILDDGNIDLFYFKLVNCIVHTTNCFLILLLYNKNLYNFTTISTQPSWVKDKFVSFKATLAALLFTLHPIHIEAVASIVGRAELLATTFGVSSLLIYHEILENKIKCGEFWHNVKTLIFWSFYVILALLASFAKEQAITYIVLGGVYDYLIHQNYNTKNKFPICRMVVLTLLISAITFQRLWIVSWTFPKFKVYDNPAIYLEGAFIRCLNHIYHALLAYWIILYPGWSCYDWSAGCISPTVKFYDPRAILILLISAAIFVLLIRHIFYSTRVHGKILTFYLAFAIVPFLPASNLFFHVGFVVAERTLYTPSIGVCWLLVEGFGRAISYIKLKIVSNSRYFLNAIYLVVMSLYISLALRTLLRNGHWHSQATLYASALKVCPKSAKVLYNIATILSANGHERSAEALYLRAISAFPSYPLPYNNLATINLGRGNVSGAIGLLDTALEYEPHLAIAWLNKGIALSNIDSKMAREGAQTCFERALNISPTYAMAHFAAATHYIKGAKLDLAKMHLERCVLFKPKFCSAWKNLIKLLLDTGNAKIALSRVREATLACPLDTKVIAVVALTFAILNDFENARNAYLSAIQTLETTPNKFNGQQARMELADLYGNLGVLYHKMRDTEKAKDMYARSLRLNPNSKVMQDNLNKLVKTSSTPIAHSQ